MTIEAEPTPNPNAMKFTIGKPIGDPVTYVPGEEYDEPMANELLAVEGVASVFGTADFITVTKEPDHEWIDISPAVIEILGNHFN